MVKTIIIGIQGGSGSYNEIALKSYMGNKDCKIKYLYTTRAVLQALENGIIDLGQFAISNTLGGVVEESIKSIGHYKFKLKDSYKVKVSHSLIIHPESCWENIDTIMSHPQALAQCQKNLSKRYAHLKKVIGEGKAIDPAFLAHQMSRGKLSKSIAMLGNEILAEKYNLKIVSKNLQDNKNNYTTFLLVSALKYKEEHINPGIV